MSVNKPNVIVIGASKCGTTALYFYLSRHPDIFLPSKKELHYHSHESLAKHIAGPGDKYILNDICKTEKEYLDHFANAAGQKVIADISPSYLFYPETSVQSIIDLCGQDTKIICLVKHPVEKMVSQYTHLLAAGRESAEFNYALTSEPERKKEGYSDMWLYAESGYMQHKLANFQKAFKNLLVLHSVDLSGDLQSTLNKIFDFIGISVDAYTDYSPISTNYSGVPKFKLISKLFIRPSWFTVFIRSIIPQKAGRFFREKINNFNKGQKFKLDAEFFKRLEKSYDEEINGLNNLLTLSSSSKIRLK